MVKKIQRRGAGVIRSRHPLPTPDGVAKWSVGGTDGARHVQSLRTAKPWSLERSRVSRPSFRCTLGRTAHGVRAHACPKPALGAQSGQRRSNLRGRERISVGIPALIWVNGGRGKSKLPRFYPKQWSNPYPHVPTARHAPCRRRVQFFSKSATATCAQPFDCSIPSISSTLTILIPLYSFWLSRSRSPETT